MKITAENIAEACGVSRGTVDRVVNGRAGVAPEVRERIQHMIDETGYRTPSMRRQSGKECVRIGFILPRWDMKYYPGQMRLGVKSALRRIGTAGFEVLIEEMQGRSVAEYMQCIARLRSAEVRGIVLNPSNVLPIEEEINRLVNSGIPVVTCNSDVPGSSRLCHIGQDLHRSGRMAAGLLARLVGEGDILIVTGNSEFTAHRGRVDGFCARLAELGVEQDRWQLIECIERYDLTYDGVLRVLRENPRLRGIYMANESVRGCVDALQRAHMAGRVHVICNDLTPWSRDYLLDGAVDFVIDQDFAGQGERAVLALYDLFYRGKTPEHSTEFVQTSIISREMVEKI